jgi:hypothetical protein
MFTPDVGYTLETLPFDSVWLYDFEFIATPGDRPKPVCMVAHELKSGRELRLWQDQFGPWPPFDVGPRSLFVAYYGSAEIGCHPVLGWQPPTCILDLFTEFRNSLNGLRLPEGVNYSLIGALIAHGLEHLDVTEKAEMRDLILRGGPWTSQERQDILAYCESDVVALRRLLLAMLPSIDLGRALLRGRYMRASAYMEHYGIPIDVETLSEWRAHWPDIQDDLIADINADYGGVYENRSFSQERFRQWLESKDIPWRLLDDGHLDLEDDTFREAERVYPIIAPLRAVRNMLADFRLGKITVGKDARNRTILSAFRSTTGRNQPSNDRYVFGPTAFYRGLIKPEPGYAIAYIDYEQQEFAIAAALSGDRNMQAAYRSGDPYLAFAKQVGGIPEWGTKRSHGTIREGFKQTALGVQYGMSAYGLAAKLKALGLDGSLAHARNLLRMHHEQFRDFWRWNTGAVNFALLNGYLVTTLGWVVQVDQHTRHRSLANFLMQANGAEMLRLACCLMIEAGLEVCGPIHDAVLLCAPTERMDEDLALARKLMGKASRIILNGSEVRTEADVVHYPNRYMDEKRGRAMWDRVTVLVAKAHQRKHVGA